MIVNAHGGATTGWLLVTTGGAQSQQGVVHNLHQGAAAQPQLQEGGPWTQGAGQLIPPARGATSLGGQHVLGNEFLPL